MSELILIINIANSLTVSYLQGLSGQNQSNRAKIDLITHKHIVAILWQYPSYIILLCSFTYSAL